MSDGVRETPSFHQQSVSIIMNIGRNFTDAFRALGLVSAVLLWAVPALAQVFQFDSSMSRRVLESYLDRSISFTELLHDDLTQPRDHRGVDPRDNLRLILSSKAKFVGRALMVWGREQELAAFLKTAMPYAAALHKADPEIILQAAAFEIVTRGVESVAIPEYVFVEFGLPVEHRNFRYQDMLYANGRFVNHWGGHGSVPDMSRLETRMWFYFLASSYIDVGIEAIHFGQVALMDKNDPGHAHWVDMLNRVRAYAHNHARRHFLLCDAHTPTGGYVEGGRLLFGCTSGIVILGIRLRGGRAASRSLSLAALPRTSPSAPSRSSSRHATGAASQLPAPTRTSPSPSPAG